MLYILLITITDDNKSGLEVLYVIVTTCFIYFYDEFIEQIFFLFFYLLRFG
jgi:hypothetical protein